MTDQATEIRLLREELAQREDRIDILEEEVRQLRSSVLKRDWYPPLEFGLTPAEAKVVGILRTGKGEVVTRDRFMSELYGSNIDDPPDPKIVDVLVCKARKKIKIYGLAIEVLWGRGYYFGAESLKILNEWPEQA